MPQINRYALINFPNAKMIKFCFTQYPVDATSGACYVVNESKQAEVMRLVVVVQTNTIHSVRTSE